MGYLKHFLRLPLRRESQFPYGKCKVAILLLFLSPQVARAEATTYPQQLQQELESFVQQRLDSYLQMQSWPSGQRTIAVWLPAGANHVPPCVQPLSIAAADHNARPWGRQLYKVECTQPSWEMQVRVEVKLVLPVMVASRDLPKGHEILPSDLQAKEMEIQRLFRDFTVDPSALLGRKTTRRIRAGQLLSQDQLQAQILVKKGDIVVIRAGTNEFSASMQGVAQQDGTLGDGVKVKNSSSGKIIQGWVVEKGVVETRY